MRLDKLMVERGVCARKMARKLVKRGLVEVDGEVATAFQGHVSPSARLVVDGVEWAPIPRVVAWHKPAGVVSSMADRHGRADLGGALPHPWSEKLHPVGRLDAETTGLLLFSADGRLTQWMLHPKRAIERSYIAVVEGAPDAELTAKLAAGVRTSDGVFTARVDGIEGAAVRLSVTEGKHRMVRRMLANAGFPVLELTRIRFGGFTLGDLPESACRAATDDELAWLTERGAPA